MDRLNSCDRVMEASSSHYCLMLNVLTLQVKECAQAGGGGAELNMPTSYGGGGDSGADAWTTAGCDPLSSRSSSREPAHALDLPRKLPSRMPPNRTCMVPGVMVDRWRSCRDADRAHRLITAFRDLELQHRRTDP